MEQILLYCGTNSGAVQGNPWILDGATSLLGQPKLGLLSPNTVLVHRPFPTPMYLGRQMGHCCLWFHMVIGSLHFSNMINKLAKLETRNIAISKSEKITHDHWSRLPKYQLASDDDADSITLYPKLVAASTASLHPHQTKQAASPEKEEKSLISLPTTPDFLTTEVRTHAHTLYLSIFLHKGNF